VHLKRASITTRLLAAATATALIAFPLARRGRAATVALPQSPSGRALVVTTNLQESYEPDDVADHADMRVYVRELLLKVPYQPDALLLQEVKETSAEVVARILSRRTGATYVVARVARRLRVETETRVTFSDSAIVLNAGTMRTVDPGGFITTSYRLEDGTRPKPNAKRAAFLLADERAGPLRLSLASLHLVRSSDLVSTEIDDLYKQRWSARIARFLQSAYPPASANDVSVVGGDFNADRCSDACPAPFWAALTGDSIAHRDAVYSVAPFRGVDYIFSNGGIYQAGVDTSYDPTLAAGDVTRFYSDHRLRWAVIGNDTVAPAAPTAVTPADEVGGVSLTWSPSTDGDGSVAGYEVWRAGDGLQFRRIATTTDPLFLDPNVYRGRTYNYYVVARDAAHNSSLPSATATIRRSLPRA
jgi:hypothetical protein